MRQCPILMYHWFRAAGVASKSRSPHLEITPELFRRQIAYLAERGYRTVRLADALSVGANSRMPSKPVVLTFDDGTADFWTHARPILRQHDFRATLFVVTGRVGQTSDWDRDLGEPPRPLLSWEQIRALHEEGFEVGSHTHTHHVLTALDDAECLEELRRSRETLTERLGCAARVLAYPRGFYEPRHKRMASEAGFDAACAVILKWSDLLRSDRFELKRMTVRGTEPMSGFKLRVGLSRIVRLRD